MPVRRPVRGFAAVAVVLALLPAAAAQVAYPDPPEKYDVHLRYRIAADRNERVRQFRAMTAGLEALGFVPAERDDADLDQFDPTADRLHGSVPSKTAFRLLDDPRVRTLVLIPAGTNPPEDAQKPTEVRISLATGFGPAEQKLLHDQAVAKLRWLGFAEGVGYDHRGHTVVRGKLPWANVLPLARDLRFLPAGWFLPATPVERLPLPFKTVQPVRAVEVLPDPAEPAAPPAPPPAPEAGGPSAVALAKLTDDMKAAIADPERQGKPIRVELIYDVEPLGGVRELELTLRATAEGARPDGLVGVVGSVRLLSPADAVKLAELPEVRVVRLARAADPTGRPVPADAPGIVPAPTLLAQTNVAALQALGYRGQGSRVAVVASGFPGAAELIGKGLPAGTRVVDLTAELEPGVVAAPETDPQAVGTVAALAVHAAAPDAALTLVRVDRAAFHQMLTVGRAVTGDRTYSLAMQTRSLELVRRGDELSGRRTAVIEEYRRAFSNLSDEETPRLRRESVQAALDALIKDEKEYRAAVDRFVSLKAGVDSLDGTGVVLNTLVWESGYPHDGLSQLSQLIDHRFVGLPTRSAIKAARQPKVPAWVQASSDALGRVWAGSYLDADDNGVMEFAPPTVPLPAGAWTRELNFLGFRPLGGPPTATLPAGLQLRVTLQWREPHDPGEVGGPDPVNQFAIRLLRQVDPTGKTAPSDEFVEVVREAGPLARLLRTPASGVYEISMQLPIPADGVYALRVERGPIPPDRFGRPRHTDLKPRVVLAVSDADATKGQAVFATFAPQAVGVGIPGDSPAAVTVGVGGGSDYRTPLTPTGAGPGVELRVKPDLLTAGAIGLGESAGAGPGVAAGFAAGTAASALSAGVRVPEIVRWIGTVEGSPLVLPTDWLRRLPGPGRVATER